MPLLPQHLQQHIYIFLLIIIFGVVQIYESFANVLRGSHFTPMSKQVDKYRPMEAILSFLFTIRWVILPLLLAPSFNTLLHILPLPIIGGYYLAFFFIISHNFEGVHMFHKHSTTDATASKSNSGPNVESFLYRQVTSSSNVGGSWLCFINGGLNYQIEHHLFPRIQHTHYPLIAPFVRKFCEDKGIPYVHFPTVWDNVTSTVKHLYSMGHKANNIKIE